MGEGWWEGTNQRGETGLFPAGYVEPVSAEPDPFSSVPPPIQATTTGQTNAPLNSQPSVDFGDGDWGEDDWDDDDSQASNSQSNLDYYPQSSGGHMSTVPISQLPPITVSGLPSQNSRNSKTVPQKFQQVLHFCKVWRRRLHIRKSRH